MKIISARQFDVLFDQVFGSRLVKSAFVANLFTKLDDAIKATTRLRSANRIAEVTKMSGITAENLIEAIGKNPDEFLRIYGSIRNRSDSILKRVIDAAWASSGRGESIEDFASAASKAGGGRQLSLLPATGETGIARGTTQLIEGASDEAANAIIAAAKRGLTAQDFERLHRAYFSAGANKKEIISALNNAFYREPGLRDIFLDFMKGNKASASFFGEILADVRGIPIYETNIKQIAGGIISAVDGGTENLPEAQRLITQLDQQISANPREVSRTLRELNERQAEILGEYYRRNRGYGIPEAIRRSEEKLGIIDVGGDNVRAISTRPGTVEPPTGTRLTSGTDDATRATTGIVDDTGRATGVTDDASRAGAAGGLPSAGTRLSYVIDESDDLGTILSKLETRPIDLTKREAAIIRRIMNENGEEFAAKLLSEESGKLKAFLTKYNNNGELGAILLEAEDIIRRNPNAVATLIREAPAASAVATQRNWGRAARVGAGIAAGLGGIALISFIMGDDDDDDDDEKPATQTTGGGSGSVTQSGSGQATGGPTTDLADKYRAASKLMMDKGYLIGIQSSWTKEFDAGFRPFIDAGTKNNRALTPTNLVGGQTWPQVAPTIGFSPDEKGALSAVSLLSKFVPSMGGKGVEERREETPQVVPGDTRAANKEDVLADIISRLYNNRLVEGGGGIFSNDLKQTQTLVDAVGGGTPAGYRNAARIILSRNPGLAGMLPESLISDVLTKQNIRRHPAYMGAKKTQETIHQIFEAANPGLINPGRVKATDNISAYLASPAGGNWKSASAEWNKIVKLAEDRKARIRENILKDLTPAEKAIIRRNKMREI